MVHEREAVAESKDPLHFGRPRGLKRNLRTAVTIPHGGVKGETKRLFRYAPHLACNKAMDCESSS
jgi:hypothetical protein